MTRSELFGKKKFAPRWAGLNGGLFQKRWTFSDNRDFTICIIRCVYRAKLILGTFPPLVPSVPPTFYSPALLPCPSLPACHLSCNSIYTVCVYSVGELHWLLFREGQPCVALRQWRGRAISTWLAVTLATHPTTNPFFTNSKKSDGRNMLQTHINTVDAITFPMVLAATPRAI